MQGIIGIAFAIIVIAILRKKILNLCKQIGVSTLLKAWFKNRLDYEMFDRNIFNCFGGTLVGVISVLFFYGGQPAIQYIVSHSENWGVTINILLIATLPITAVLFVAGTFGAIVGMCYGIASYLILTLHLISLTVLFITTIISTIFKIVINIFSRTKQQN